MEQKLPPLIIYRFHSKTNTALFETKTDILNYFSFTPYFCFMNFRKAFSVLISSTLLLFASCKSSKNTTNTESLSSKKTRTKYASLIGVSENQISNINLYSFIDEWYGVPYKYSGKTKSGIDCSGFTSLLLQKVYSKNIGGSASSIYDQCKSISKKDLQAGDLVFFKIESDKISHIGVYLQNNKFVHASTKKGVIINDLNEDYYKKYYYKSARP